MHALIFIAVMLYAFVEEAAHTVWRSVRPASVRRPSSVRHDGAGYPYASWHNGEGPGR